MKATAGARDRRGQAMTEFALVVPFFLLLLFGLVDLSRFVFAANALNNSAREAARFATVAYRPAECGGQTRAQCATTIARSHAWGVPANGVNVTVSCERFGPSGAPVVPAPTTAACRTDDFLVVRTELEFTLLTPLIAQMVGDQTLTGESRVTVNQ